MGCPIHAAPGALLKTGREKRILRRALATLPSAAGFDCMAVRASFENSNEAAVRPQSAQLDARIRACG